MFRLKMAKKPKLFKLKFNFIFPQIVLANMQEKEITPTKEIQIVEPDRNYDGLSKVIVDKIPDEYIIPQGNLEISQNGTYDVIDKASVNVDVQPNLQIKNATPTTSSQNITADAGYDGLSSVSISAVDSSIDSNIVAGNIKNGIQILGVTGTLNEGITPSGELAITENGTYDVTNYASANVNVPTKTLGTKTITANGTYLATDDNLDGYSEVNVETSGVDINDYFNDTISKITTRDYVGSWQTVIKKFRSPLKINGTDGQFMFYGYPLSEIPTLIGMENVTDMREMFCYSYSLTDLDLTSWNTSSAKRMKQMFYGCSYLTNLNLSSFNTSNVTTMEQMFGNCSRLTNLNISNFDFTNVTNYSGMFSGVPSDCYILVKDATAKEWITSKFTNLTKFHYLGEEG